MPEKAAVFQLSGFATSGTEATFPITLFGLEGSDSTSLSFECVAKVCPSPCDGVNFETTNIIDKHLLQDAPLKISCPDASVTIEHKTTNSVPCARFHSIYCSSSKGNWPAKHTYVKFHTFPRFQGTKFRHYISLLWRLFCPAKSSTRPKVMRLYENKNFKEMNHRRIQKKYAEYILVLYLFSWTAKLHLREREKGELLGTSPLKRKAWKWRPKSRSCPSVCPFPVVSL